MEHSSDAIADLLIQALGDINPGLNAVGQRLYQVEGYGPNGEQVGREFTSHEMQTVLNNLQHGQWTITIDQLEKESVPDPVALLDWTEPSDDVTRYLPDDEAPLAGDVGSVPRVRELVKFGKLSEGNLFTMPNDTEWIYRKVGTSHCRIDPSTPIEGVVKDGMIMNIGWDREVIEKKCECDQAEEPHQHCAGCDCILVDGNTTDPDIHKGVFTRNDNHDPDDNLCVTCEVS
jgi:hypothetical protein